MKMIFPTLLLTCLLSGCFLNTFTGGGLVYRNFGYKAPKGQVNVVFSPIVASALKTRDLSPIKYAYGYDS